MNILTCKHCKKPQKGPQRVTGGRWRGIGKRGASENMSGQVQTREQAGLCTCVLIEVTEVSPVAVDTVATGICPSRVRLADDMIAEIPEVSGLRDQIIDENNAEVVVPETVACGPITVLKLTNLWEVAL